MAASAGVRETTVRLRAMRARFTSSSAWRASTASGRDGSGGEAGAQRQGLAHAAAHVLVGGGQGQELVDLAGGGGQRRIMDLAGHVHAEMGELHEEGLFGGGVGGVRHEQKKNIDRS